MNLKKNMVVKMKVKTIKLPTPKFAKGKITMRFKVYEVVILINTTRCLSEFIRVLHKNKLKYNGGYNIEDINKLKSRLEKSIECYNLNNIFALLKYKHYTLTIKEHNILQNSLCLSIGLQDKYRAFDEFIFSEIKRLHKRFEHTFNRVFAGYKAKGYILNTAEIEKWRKRGIHHEPEKMISRIE